MKRFKFSLEEVLSYKQQILESLQIEQGELLRRAEEQRRVLERSRTVYADYGAEYARRCAEGLSASDVMMYQMGLRAQEKEIERESHRLQERLNAVEEKKKEVVEAKKETSTLEKLRENKLEDYNKAAAKLEEQFIEEFVSTLRSVKDSDHQSA